MTAADAAGVPVGAWVEQALRQALEAKAEPARPERVELDELEAMVRRVVAEELRPVEEALAQATTTTLPSAPAAGSPVKRKRRLKLAISLVDDSVRDLCRGRRLRQRGPAPVLADSEVLTVEIVGEFLGLDTDRGLHAHFRRHFGHLFPGLRTVHRAPPSCAGRRTCGE